MAPNPSTRSVLRKVLVTCFAVSGCLAWATNASAQPLGPVPIIAGVPVQCGGVPTVVQQIPDIAMAGGGAIILNPMLFGLPGPLQLFIYAHECAHHIQGPNDAAADCWAIRTGRVQGWFTANDISYLIQYFGNNPGDWSHAPGPQRVANMMACFSSASRSVIDGAPSVDWASRSGIDWAAGTVMACIGPNCRADRRSRREDSCPSNLRA